MTEVKAIRIVHAEPSGLGVFGLSLITLVASSQKLGITEGVVFILPWAILLGGIAQLIACIHDYKLQNVFGATVFGAYGLFWITIGFIWMIRLGFFGPEIAALADPKQLGMAYVGYFIFSLYVTVAASETNKAFFIIIVLIDVLFITLALDAFGFAGWSKIAAVSELGISLVGFYAGAGTLLNSHFGRQIVPLGKPLGLIKRS